MLQVSPDQPAKREADVGGGQMSEGERRTNRVVLTTVSAALLGIPPMFGFVRAPDRVDRAFATIRRRHRYSAFPVQANTGRCHAEDCFDVA